MKATPISTFENFRFRDNHLKHVGVCSLFYYPDAKLGPAIVATDIEIGRTPSVQFCLTCIANTLGCVKELNWTPGLFWYSDSLGDFRQVGFERIQVVGLPGQKWKYHHPKLSPALPREDVMELLGVSAERLPGGYKLDKLWEGAMP